MRSTDMNKLSPDQSVAKANKECPMESQEISATDERERDEVVKRMLATPPQPREKPKKKKAKT